MSDPEPTTWSMARGFGHATTPGGTLEQCTAVPPFPRRGHLFSTVQAERPPGEAVRVARTPAAMAWGRFKEEVAGSDRIGFGWSRSLYSDGSRHSTSLQVNLRWPRLATTLCGGELMRRSAGPEGREIGFKMDIN